MLIRISLTKLMPLTNSNFVVSIGHVPLLDSAPLLVAQQENLFEKYGAEVKIEDQVGWATVRDKLIHGELDMASTLIGLPYAMHHGVGCFETNTKIPLILSMNGNSITLTSDISPEDLNNQEAIAEALEKRTADKDRKWTFATVNPYSSHLILLSKWLNTYLSSHISEIEIVFIPPQLLPDLLEQGMIDGYCAGEPWGSLATKNGVGHIVSNSLELSPDHPEKILAVPQRTIETKEEGVIAVGKALLEACQLCQSEDYTDKLVSILSNYDALELKETDTLNLLKNKSSNNERQHKFYGDQSNIPTPEREQWVIKGLKEAGLFRKKVISTGQIMTPELLFKE